MNYDIAIKFSLLAFSSAVLFARCQADQVPKNNEEPKVPDSKTVVDLNKRLTKLVTDWGFTLEIHEVKTEDGYLLELHRLGKRYPSLKAPVLIQHGITGCSPSFLAFRKSVAYYLAEAGYDVWVSNARGSAFSMKHERLKPSQKKFWDFSFHEIGSLDLPAMFRYIKVDTQAPKVHFVATSMGTTSFFVMAVTRPERVREDVASVSLMAPVACPRNHRNVKSKTRRIVKYAVLTLMKKISRGEIYTYRKSLAMLKYKMCKSKGFWGDWCEKKLRMISNGKHIYDHVGALEVLPFFPCGASIKTYLHFIQTAAEGKFQQFDYGKEGNKREYKGKEKPPQYDVGSIDKKLYLLIGGADDKAHLKDIKWLEDRLKSYVKVTETLEDFDHRDFEYGLELEKVGKIVEEIIKAEEEGRGTDSKILGKTVVKSTSNP